MAIDAKTAKFIEDDVRTSERQLQQIDEQIESLRAQKEALKLKITALKGISGLPNSFGVETIAGTIVPSAKTSYMPKIASIAAASLVANQSPPKTIGFRDAIRDVLKASTRGMTGRDVTQALRDKGFTPGGTVEPSTRVATELYRMNNAQQIRKRGNMYYALEATA